MLKIPLYYFKPLEELARAVLVAVLAYIATAIVVGGIPDSAETWRALAAGALPIAIAAMRAWLNKTPVTPPVDEVPVAIITGSDGQAATITQPPDSCSNFRGPF